MDYRVAHRFLSSVQEDKLIPVKFTKTCYGLSEFMHSLPEPVDQDFEALVPRWLARRLVAKGYAVYSATQVALKAKLSTAIYREEQSNALQKLDEGFYAELGATIEELSDAEDPSLSAVQSKLQDYLRMRAKKIRRLAETKQHVDFLDSLALEERCWFADYRRLFQEWVDGGWFTEQSGFGARLWLKG